MPKHIAEGITTTGSGNVIIGDSTTLIVDATNHRVGIGTATPTQRLTVAGGGQVDFFGGRFNVNDTTGVTTISDLSATATSFELVKSQNTSTVLNIRNINAGAAAISALNVNNGTNEASILMTGTGYTGFPNAFTLTTGTTGGMLLESTASNIILACGASDSLELNTTGALFYYNIKSGATQALAGAAVSEIWKTNGHATLPNNVLMIGV